ncbi:Cbp1 family collagen-binding glycoprotein adhesin [Fulvivirga lutea]|uniref:Chromosome segregation protein SMC n=1 Tax=Fulvivirga lutea TaxID=2810512 RepID=A0A974WM98_9BACT|nr:hypothetical protein [Fulvivirga lutea]QSE98028.1 hypothetical protein JR347_02805 [Fulvivirga lutea]
MKYKLLMSVLVIVAIACGESKEEKEIAALKEKVTSLQSQNTSLRNGDQKLKATLEDYNKFFTEIEKNLAGIDQNKTMVAQLSADMKDKKDVKERIKLRISTIKELVENTRLRILALDRTIAQLRKESGEKSDEIMQMDKQIKGLTKDLIAKDAEIEEMDNSIADLETLYQLEIEKTEELRSILNRAYYIVGTKKELLEKGVITKEGGFIGIGKVKVLNANAPTALFTKIEKDKTSEMMLNAKKAKMITNHADGSFSIAGENGKADKLMISDADEFWKNGNYVVIEVEK